MATRKVNLGYNLTHFLNFPEQLASRLEDHRTTGNQLSHALVAPIVGVASLALINLAAGYGAAVACGSILVIWCLMNDLLYGLIYAVYSVTTTILQLHYGYGPTSLFPSLLMLVLGLLFQILVGHTYFERRPPNELEGIVKGEGRVFAVLDLTCELVPATFHFYTILLIRLGFRPNLNQLVQKELHRIKERIAKR